MKIRMKKYAALFCALCTVLVVISGCGNLNDPYSLPQKGGESTLILNISDGSSNGRTIAPASIAFTQYRVTIKEQGKTTVAYTDVYAPNASIVIDLRDGDYDVYAEGIVDEAVVAKAEELNVQLRHGTPQTINIALAAILNEGTGTFAWALEFDSNITAAAMQIKRGEGETKTNVGASVNVKDGTHHNGSNATLAAGIYDVVFTLTFGSETVEWIETLHVYKGLTSTFIWAFGDLRLSTLDKMVEDAIKAKATTGITPNHFTLLDIQGVTGSNLDALLDKITWVEDLTTSVDIALVRIHTWTAYHDKDALVLAINTAMPNGTTVLAANVTENTGATPHTATFSIKGESITISGFTYTDAVITQIAVGDAGQRIYFQHYSTPADLTALAAALEVTATYNKALPAGGTTGPLGSSQYTISPALNTINFGAEQTGPRTETFTVRAAGTDPAVTTTFAITILPLDSITTNEASLPITQLRRAYYQYIDAPVDLEEVTVTGHWKPAVGELYNHVLKQKNVDLAHNVEINGADFGFETAGEKTITMSYHGKETEITVTVYPLNTLVIPAAIGSNTIPTEASIKALIESGSFLVQGSYGLQETHSFPTTGTGFVNSILSQINVAFIPVSTVFPLSYSAKLTWNRTAPLPPIESNDCIITVTDTPVVSSITVVDNSGPFYQYITPFNSDGVTVTAHYTLGKESEVVTDGVVIIPAPTEDVFDTEDGEYIINVTYQGVSTSYTVTVIAAIGLEITGNVAVEYPNNPTGDQVLANVTKIEAVYFSEVPEQAHKEVIAKNHPNLSVIVDGDAETIIIKWHHLETPAYTYTLPAPVTLLGIAVTGSVGSHYQYFTTPFNPAGLTVTATYSNSTTQPVGLGDANLTFAGYALATSGTQTITASYNGKTATTTVNVIALDSIEIVGVNATYDAHPGKPAILTAITAVNAVYGEHKIDIKGLLNDVTDVVVTEDGLTGSVKVTWHKDATVTYTIPTESITLFITAPQFLDTAFDTINIGNFSITDPASYSVSLGSSYTYTSVKWTLNGVVSDNTTTTFIGPHNDASTIIGANVLKVEVVLDGKTYSKNIVYRVTL